MSKDIQTTGKVTITNYGRGVNVVIEDNGKAVSTALVKDTGLIDVEGDNGEKQYTGYDQADAGEAVKRYLYE